MSLLPMEYDFPANQIPKDDNLGIQSMMKGYKT